MRCVGALLVLALASVLTIGCVLRPPAPGTIATSTRMETFRLGVPASYARNHGPLTIYWSPHQVPFIDASDDRDVPYAMGLVHAHLRMGQMEVLRLLSQGRLSEVAGPVPIVVDISHALHALDYPKAAVAIEASLRPDTRAWLERYVEGLNDYRQSLERAGKPLAHEFGVLGLSPTPWTLRDIIGVGRLAGTDINWGAFASHLRMANSPHWNTLRERLARFHDDASPSFGPRSPDAPLDALDTTIDLANSVGKTGSNSFVVSGVRTPTGMPLLANDPHVGFTLPALWCAVGYRSPSLHATGLTIPGIPFIVLGRNPHIAWGGTNMQGISSSLFDVSSLGPEEFTTREVRLERRFWFPTTRRVRDSSLGPVITDLPIVQGWKGPPLALKWRGHQPSDEYSAFLDASRATNWEQFRAAWEPYAVSGQNFVYADVEGNIGQLLAFEFLPAAGRTARLPIADPTNPQHAWTDGSALPSTRLPASVNPERGYLVSTNNTPVRLDPPLVVQGNWNDRQDRISSLIEERPVDRARASTIQRDAYSASSHALARAILARAGERSIAHPLLTELATWDASYAKDSRGALVFQALLEQLVPLVYTSLYDQQVAQYLLDSLATYQLLREDVEQGHADVFLAQALASAARHAPKDRVWGDVHRLAFQHPLGMVPLIGSYFSFGDEPVDGSLATVFKSAAPITAKPHTTRYGANARQIIDLAHPDEHYIAFVGGQDGWFGSQNFLDLTPAWRSGDLVRLPLTIEGVRRDAAFTTTLDAPRVP